MKKITFSLVFATLYNVSFAQTTIVFEQVTPAYPNTANIAEFDNIGPSFLSFFDADNDGDEDVLLVGGNSNGPVTKLFINDGSGNFYWNDQAGFTPEFGGGGSIADIDGDGDKDVILIGGPGEPGTNLYKNNGSGIFTLITGTTFTPIEEWLHGCSATFLDADNDNDQDVLITGMSNGDIVAKLYLNDGSGNFNLAGTIFDGGWGPVAAADIDNDGDSDLLMEGVAGMNLYTNDGAGNFTVVSEPFGDVLDGTINFSDTDNDNDLDVIISGREYSTGILNTFLYTNDGSGNYVLMTGTPFIGVQLSAVAIADIDNDGYKDIIVSGRDLDNTDRTSLYKNEGANSFSLISSSFEPMNQGAIAFSDVENDGDVDLLAGGNINGPELYRTCFHINDGAGNFALVTSSPFMGVTDAETIFSDVDNDSDPDILIMGINNSNVGQARLYLNDGIGNYMMTVVPPFEGLNGGTMGVADVDGDGDDDVLVTGYSFASSPVARLYLNSGSGSYSLVDSTTFTPLYLGTIDFEDIDGDGDKDVLMTGMDVSGTSNLYKNNGAGEFTLSSSLEGVWKSATAFSDIDNDGDLDLILTGMGSNNWEIGRLYTNDGTGNFTWQQFIGTPGLQNGSISVSDIDNDGDNDFFLTGEPVGTFSQFLINNGDLTFTWPVNTPVEGLKNSASTFSDIDGDGDDDLIVSGLTISDEPITKLFANDGTGHFTLVENMPFTNIYRGGIAFADTDNDGDEDFLMAGLKETNWSIAKLYRNNTVFNSFFTVNTFSIPSDANNCVGVVSISAMGNPDFTFDIDNGTTQITSSGYAMVNDLCPGIHNLLTTDILGDNLTTTFIIPTDSNYIYNNPFIDSLALDSIGTTIENCDIYYNGIDTAYIQDIFANADTVTVTWTIVDANGVNTQVSTYVLGNGSGVYELQLSVFCPQKALGQYFTVTQVIYFDGETAHLAGIRDNQLITANLYPNPTIDLVTITFSDPSAKVVVYDVQGKRIAQQTMQSGGQISLAGTQSGVYFFELTTENGKAVKRVIKQ